MSEAKSSQQEEKKAKIRRREADESILTPTFAASRYSTSSSLWDRNQQGSGLLQRQCACGTHTIGGGECDRCRRKREASFLQRVAVNSVYDNAASTDLVEVQAAPGLDSTYDFSRGPKHLPISFGQDFVQVPISASAYTTSPSIQQKVLSADVAQRFIPRSVIQQASADSQPSMRENKGLVINVSRPAGYENINSFKQAWAREMVDRIFISTWANAKLVEEAKKKDSYLRNYSDDLGPNVQSEIAETLLLMHKDMDRRIKAALGKKIKFGPDGLIVPPDGVSWSSPEFAGMVEGIDPFHMIDWWGSYIKRKSVKRSKDRRRVTRFNFDKGSIVEGNKKPKLTNKPSPNKDDVKDKEAIKKLLKERYKLTNETLDKISGILDRISDVTSLIDLLSTLGLLGEGAGAVAGLAAIPLYAISAGIALYDAYNFDRTKYEMLCTAYTYTAWAFNEPMPAQSATFFARYQERPTRHDVLRAAWKKTQKDVLTHLRQLAKKHKLKESDTKLGLRYIVAENSKEKLIKLLIDQFVNRMSSKPSSHVDAVRSLKDYASIYPN